MLSIKYNTSFGFFPVIISMLLCGFLTQDISVYLGAGIGIVYSAYTIWVRKLYMPNLILYFTTSIMLFLSIPSFLFGDFCSTILFPFMLEISILIPCLFFFLNRKKICQYSQEKNRSSLKQGIESSIVSARVLIIVAILHFLVVSLLLLFAQPLGYVSKLAGFTIGPLFVFILTIVFNQFGVIYFNKIMKETPAVPVVNIKGEVIGKCSSAEAISGKNNYINPIIRIVISHNGMLYLRPRPLSYIVDKGKVDIPMESYLFYGETLKEGVKRLVQQTHPQLPNKDISFNLTYHFENPKTNRLVYLFLLEVEDEKTLNNKHIKNGKLWTFQQIEQNLNKNFFSSNFEHEYEHIKDVICIREKYKEF